MRITNSYASKRKPSYDGWSPQALNKALVHELFNKLLTILPRIYPQFTLSVAEMAERTRPVRLSDCGRFLRAWGRSFQFTTKESVLVKKIVAAYEGGIRQVTWSGIDLATHPATAEGIIQHKESCYWLQEPPDEINKPVQVTFTADSNPYAGIEKEVLALAWLQQCPEWSDEQIALKIGIARTSIYRFEKYQAARALLQQGRRDYLENQLTERHSGKGGLRMMTAAARERGQ